MFMQASQLSPEEKKPYSDLEISFNSKKRKFIDQDDDHEEDIELNLSTTPLPLDWQRCLDIKSGKIHFYNMRTHMRTPEDPCRTIVSKESNLVTTPSTPPHNLDLELNLAWSPRCRSSVNVVGEEEKTEIGGAAAADCMATVCMRCHMLVIISKATMTCPSCKFVHPPESCNFSSAAPSVRPPLKLLC